MRSGRLSTAKGGIPTGEQHRDGEAKQLLSFAPLKDQKNVSLLRFIKREKDGVKNLVKKRETAGGVYPGLNPIIPSSWSKQSLAFNPKPRRWGYAWHLAKVAGENESQPDHARMLAGVTKDMENLYQSVRDVAVENKFIGDELDQGSTTLACVAASAKCTMT